MNRVFLPIFATIVFLMPLCAQEKPVNNKADKTTPQTTQTSPQVKESPQSKPVATTQAAPATTKKADPATPKTSPKVDSLIVIARVMEIPGKFAPNDLYNYLYVMKYRVLQVVSGNLAAKEICVGHYNPLIPRSQIKDKMASVVKGNVEKIEVGSKHRLVLAQPIDKYWNDATEDEFIDVEDSDKYFALRTDVAQ